MRSILSIAKYTVIEQIRNRLYLVILFFGALIVVASILMGALAPGHQVRVIFDLGLVTIELFSLVTAVFGAVTLVTQEIESKTIYLLMTRPLPRASYILGRYLGLIAAVVFTILVMAAIHIGIILMKPYEFRVFTDGINFWAVYPLLILMTIGKLLMTTAIALFFSLFATSAASAMVFTSSFWVAGHFGTELSFMIDKSLHGAGAFIGHKIAMILPNFQYFNFRDTFSFPGFPGLSFLGWALLYGLAYTSFFLALSSIWFSKKEF